MEQDAQGDISASAIEESKDDDFSVECTEEWKVTQSEMFRIREVEREERQRRSVERYKQQLQVSETKLPPPLPLAAPQRPTELSASSSDVVQVKINGLIVETFAAVFHREPSSVWRKQVEEQGLRLLVVVMSNKTWAIVHDWLNT